MKAFRLRKVPGPALRWPLLGEMIPFGVNPKGFVLKRMARFGPIFRSHVWGAPLVVMVGAEALRFLLSTHRDHFLSGKGWPRGLARLMEGSLLLQDGEKHDKTRRLLGRAFSGAAVASYVPTMEATTRRYLERWEGLRRFALYDEIKILTFDIAAQLLLGAPPGAAVERLNALFAAYTRGMEGMNPLFRVRLPFTPFGRACRARDALLAYVAGTAEARRERPGADALSLLVAAADENAAMTLDEVARHAMFLLFAGHESTTSLIASACLELARHPEALEKARGEERGLEARALSHDLLERRTYLDAVLTETERLHPPFPGSFRYVDKPFEFNGYHVPQGTRIFYSIHGTHHDGRVHARPEQFDPDRFDGDAAHTMRKGLHIAGFGGGSRICLGMTFARAEAKVVLSHLLRGYEWTLVPGQRLEPTYLPSVMPKDRLRVVFRRLQ